MNIFRELNEYFRGDEHTKGAAKIKSTKQQREEQTDGLYGEGAVGMNTFNTWMLISKLRDLNDNYKARYYEYLCMAEDVIIQRALEMYADDATQVDTKTTKIVNIESKNKVLAKDLNAFLESIDIENRIWTWVYQTAQFGDCFLKIHKDLDKKVMWIEDNIDPSAVLDLYEDGIRVGYGEQDLSEYRNYKRKTNPHGFELLIKHPDEFVHFMVKRSARFDILEIPIDGEFDENGDYLVRKFTIQRGVSMLEGVRSIFRILQLLEDTLLAARIAMAEFVRVFNIEVGQSTPKQTTEFVNSVKNLFDSKATFDVNTGRYTSHKLYRPLGDPVFNPTRDGKGNISHENIGGDFQVKDINDINYFMTKLFAGLKIPPQFFGLLTERLPGGLGDETLTRLDIIYSRAEKVLQNSIIIGIKELCCIWLRLNGREDEAFDAEFKITLQAPSTAEELGRLTEFDMKMTTINNIVGNLSNVYNEHINLPKVFKILSDTFLDYPELKDELEAELNAAIQSYEKAMNFEQYKRDKAEEEIRSGKLNVQDVDISDMEHNYSPKQAGGN